MFRNPTFFKPAASAVPLPLELSAEDFPSRETLAAHPPTWYVHRSARIRDIMTGWWRSGPDDPKTMEGASITQIAHRTTNVLFANMRLDGPSRREFNNFKYDKKNDLYHCHVTTGRNTYVVTWEADEITGSINIVDIGPHENFRYLRTHKKTDVMKRISTAKQAEEEAQEKAAAMAPGK